MEIIVYKKEGALDSQIGTYQVDYHPADWERRLGAKDKSYKFINNGPKRDDYPIKWFSPYDFAYCENMSWLNEISQEMKEKKLFRMSKKLKKPLWVIIGMSFFSLCSLFLMWFFCYQFVTFYNNKGLNLCSLIIMGIILFIFLKLLSIAVIKGYFDHNQ